MDFVATLEAERARPHHHGGPLQGVQSEETAQSPHELEADRSKLKSELDALLNSVGVAIARRLSHPKRNAEKRIQEYVQVQQTAQNIRSALDDPSALARMSVLTSMETVIRANFTADIDADDKSDDSAAALPVMVSPKTLDEPVENHPLMLRLHYRAHRLHGLIADHTALAAHAANIGDAAKGDLAAAITVASLLHAGKHAECEAFIRRTEVKLLPPEASTPDSFAQERLGLIIEEGKHIRLGMEQGQEEASRRVVEAARYFITVHVDQHRKEGEAYFADAHAHLAEYMAPEHLKALEAAHHAWCGRMDEMAGRMTEELQAARGSGSRDNALEGVFTHLKHMGARNAEGLCHHCDIYTQALKQTEKAQKELDGLLRGDFNAGNANHLAKTLGVDKQCLVDELAAFHHGHGIPCESAQTINARIARVNAIWKEHHHVPRQGMEKHLV